MDDLSILLPKLATVFGWAFFSFWTAIPGGVALGLPPLLSGLTAWISYSLGAVIVVVIGEPLRARLSARFNTRGGLPTESRIGKLIAKYGVSALGLLAPMTLGSQTGAILGLGLGFKPRPLALWITLGGAGWAIVITLLTAFGATLAQPR